MELPVMGSGVLGSVGPNGTHEFLFSGNKLCGVSAGVSLSSKRGLGAFEDRAHKGPNL